MEDSSQSALSARQQQFSREDNSSEAGKQQASREHHQFRRAARTAGKQGSREDNSSEAGNQQARREDNSSQQENSRKTKIETAINS